MKPSVGRIVHFAGGDFEVMKGEEAIAAIVTKVYTDTHVALTVLAPNTPPMFLDSIPYSEEPNSGMRWFWPPRV